MRHQRYRTAPNLAPLDHGKINRWALGCMFVQDLISLLLAVLYNWLLGISFFAVTMILIGFFCGWAFDDDLCGFPFPGPRLTTQLDQSCQNEVLEMQPIHNEGIWARMPYSNISTYGYCPVNGEVAVDDNPPPYDVLPAPNNATIMINNTAITDDALTTAPHHFTKDKPAEPQEYARSPTGQQSKINTRL
ncbi:hypothetical protein FHL15_011228 [Xylaria flabelliformis]|uniref:Uncharacterized protein n=1 Tax=Xylaria flabelliformis TaxID=2512241 RepID=A0A553HIV9_9PEZI|nr:hypothetical protein FHL15_011228 [Xylaria flabelliformis]